MSEPLALLDMIIENFNNTQKEIKHELDAGAFNKDIEALLIYLLERINSLKSETERARKAYSENKNVFW